MEIPGDKRKTIKDVCKLMYSTLGYAIKTYARLHATIRSWRPANDDNDSKKVLENLEKSVANVVSGKNLIKRAFKMFSSKNIDENNWREFCGFWNQLSTYLNDDKNLTTESAVELMRQEIKHIWTFQGLFHLCQLYPPRPESITIKEYQRLQLLWRYVSYLTNFTTVSYLFLDVQPHRLPPNVFFSNADATYFFISAYFESVIVKGWNSDYFYIYGLTCNFVQMGTMCPKSKLKFSNPQEAEFSVMQRFGGSSLSPRKRFNISLLSRVKVVKERFSSYSVALGSKMLTGVWVTFFRGCYVLQLFDSVMNDAIKKVKSVYIEMRRIVYYNFLRIFRMQELPREIQKLFKRGVHLYFHDCIELLKLCRKSIANVKKDEASLEYETRQAYRKVYVPYKTLCSVLPGICKEAVIEFVRQFYVELRANLPKETTQHIIAFADTCAKKGNNPMMYQQARGFFERAIHTFVRMCSELDTAIDECHDSTLVVLEGRARASQVLRNYFVSAGNKVPQVQGYSGQIKIILRLLPLNNELREAIVRIMGPIFVGSELEIGPTALPKRSFYEQTNIDMTFYVPPQEDILTKEQLHECFKIRSKWTY